MNTVRHRTPDTGWAWVISVSCAVINGLTWGLVRSFGVFFFYLRQEFTVSRQVASWPFALCTSVTYLSGPITGFLVGYFHLRTIVFVGIVLTASGFGACFFVTDLSQIVVLVGVVHGFGIGLSYMQTPVILAQYFLKYQATATAISYAGGTVGSFIFPALVEYLIASYGMRGTFLIIGGILLNGLPCALLLRPPVSDFDPRSHSTTNASQSYHSLPSTRSIRSIHHKLKRKRSEKWLFLRKSSIDLFAEKMNSKNSLAHLQQQRLHRAASDSMYRETDPLGVFTLENIKMHKKRAKAMNHQFNETEMLVMESTHATSSTTATPAVSYNHRSSSVSSPLLTRTSLSASDTDTVTNPIRPPMVTKNKYCQTVPQDQRNHFAHSVVTIATNPMYLILLITHVIFQWAWITYQMVIFDFGMDQNLSRSQSVSILVSFAVADLFGRMLSGWVADKKYIKKNHLVSICILCIGFFIQLTSMITTYRTHLALAILLGFTCGVIIVLFNLLTMEYVGLDNLPVALGLSAFAVGLTALARPNVIGLFRDVFGSYRGLFRFTGILSFLAALLWLMEPFAILNFKRKSNLRQQSLVGI